MTKISSVEEFDTEINRLLKKTVLTFTRKKKLLLVSEMAQLTSKAYRQKLIKQDEMQEWFTKVFGKYGFKEEDYVQ